jgi:DNA-directed RNA polymerase subunit RPC12/RpoP
MNRCILCGKQFYITDVYCIKCKKELEREQILNVTENPYRDTKVIPIRIDTSSTRSN